MPQFRNPRGTLRARTAIVFAVAASSLITGSNAVPTISAEAPAGGPPQFLTWQLNTHDAMDAVTAPLTRRRIAPRPGSRRLLTRDAVVDAELPATPADASDPVTLLQSFTGANLGDTGSLP